MNLKRFILIFSHKLIPYLYFASAPMRHLHSHPDWLQLNHFDGQLFKSEAIKVVSREMMKIISVS